MYKGMFCILLALTLSSCSLFSIQRLEIEQGNIITTEKVNQLHRGMSEEEVKDIMGTPLMTTFFTPNRMEYIYTLQKSNQQRLQKRVICIFQNGRLQEIIQRF